MCALNAPRAKRSEFTNEQSNKALSLQTPRAHSEHTLALHIKVFLLKYFTPLSVWYTIFSTFIQCKKHNFKSCYIRPNRTGRSQMFSWVENIFFDVCNGLINLNLACSDGRGYHLPKEPLSVQRGTFSLKLLMGQHCLAAPIMYTFVAVVFFFGINM